jgi:hypothetical protein
MVRALHLTMSTASNIRVGQVVEFEVGEPALVMSVEENWTASEPDPHPYLLQHYGKSLVFGCSYSTLDPELAAIEGENTAYVRRELSPVSGGRVVR